jgi:hypothetical protein
MDASSITSLAAAGKYRWNTTAKIRGLECGSRFRSQDPNRTENTRTREEEILEITATAGTSNRDSVTGPKI